MPKNIQEKYNEGDRNFVGINLIGQNLAGAIFVGSNFCYANLSGADLSGADLTGANLSNANLSEAVLAGADLTDAGLTGANLSNANLSGADLGGANLSDANLSGAKGLVSPEKEMEIIQWISQEIVKHDLLRQIHWHESGSWKEDVRQSPKRGESVCRTAHCAAGSAQLYAYLHQEEEGMAAWVESRPSIAGSMLVPTLAFHFYEDDWDMGELIDSILSGRTPLLQR